MNVRTAPVIVETPTFIAEVERRLTLTLDWTGEGPDPDVLGTAARHLCMASDAKRARPHLVLLFGTALGADTDALADMAVAAECIHAASLLHDDVVDEGTTRRGQPTANALLGNHAAVLAGDLVLVRALETLRSYPRVLSDEAHAVIASMTRSALAEAMGRGNASLSLDAWRSIADGKTGVLLGWCGRAAARLAGDEEALRRFDVCGRHLGMAYQLADDLRDLCRDDEGKDRFADIRNANPSYPLLWAANESPMVRDSLQRAWNDDEIDVERLGSLVLQTGAADATVEAIDAEATAALDALGPYGERPGGAELARWVQLLLYRSLALREEVA